MKKTYKNFTIEYDNFRESTRFMGMITHVRATNNNIYGFFIFNVSRLDINKFNINLDDLRGSAVGKVMLEIDGGLRNKTEMTFHFEEPIFGGAKNPDCWILLAE